MKPELKDKIEALVAEVVAAVAAGETTIGEAALVMLTAHREAGAAAPQMGGMMGGLLGAMAGASLFAGLGKGPIDHSAAMRDALNQPIVGHGVEGVPPATGGADTVQP